MRQLVLFSDLQHNDFRLIHEPIDDLHFDAGDSLFRAGDSARHVYTIRGGLVKLELILRDGTSRIVRLLRQGDVAGLEALTDSPYAQDAVALEPVDVCRIPSATVNRLNEETPRLHRQLTRRWQEAVHDADAWLTDLMSGSARMRVLRLLRHLAGLADAQRFYLPSREDIGAMLAITTETASRIVAELRRNGVLTVLDAHHARADLAAIERLLAAE